MPLDRLIRSRVEHLYDADVMAILSGKVKGSPEGPPLPADDLEIIDTTVDGPGGPIPIRIYRPAGAQEPLPVVLWAHGGAWMFGSLDMPEAHNVAIVTARATPAVVISIDYRLAPANPYPAAMDDYVAVARHAMANATSLGIDRDRVVVGGASAGGNIAAAAALVLRDAGDEFAALWLAYPVTNPAGGPYPPAQFPEAPPIMHFDADNTSVMFSAYLGDAGLPDSIGAPAVPAEANLAGLPKTLVTGGEFDGLTMQGQRFVELAVQAGVAASHVLVAGVLHGYLNLVGDTPVCETALDGHVDWLREALIDS